MKIRNILLGAIFLASGAASASTVFEPTDGDVNFLFSTLGPATILAMFDDSDQTFAGTALVIPLPSIVGITGPSGGNFLATNSLAQTLTLTGSDRFILGISTDSGTSWSGDTLVTSVGANAYNVTFSDGTVLEVDVVALSPPSEVPVPSAVWLFGSGLLGLVGIARRKKAA